MQARTKSALLWGVVGLMSFVVLAQGSVALGEQLLTFQQALVVALLVGAATAAVAYRFERRIAVWAADRRT